MTTAITSLGMLTSIGHDVETSCASLRAGLTRPRPLEQFELAEVGEEPEGITGHPIFPFTQGFYQLGLWVRVATECLADLIRYGRLPEPSQTDFWKRTALVAAVPLLASGRLLLPADQVEQMLKEHYLQPVVDLLELPVPPQNLCVEELGHCAAAQAIVRAMLLMQGRQIDRVIVLGVDSYTDRFSLEWLLAANALKTRAHPVGAMPGEAGACFLLEAPHSLRQRAPEVEAFVGEPEILLNTDSDRRDPVEIGRRLAEVIRVVSSVTGGSLPSDVYLDLNGEEWRAHAWGVAQVLMRQPAVLGHHREIIPCTSLGETGSASGALATCLAVRSLVRRYALGSRSLICSVNERGDVSAFAVMNGAS